MRFCMGEFVGEGESAKGNVLSQKKFNGPSFELDNSGNSMSFLTETALHVADNIALVH